MIGQCPTKPMMIKVAADSPEPVRSQSRAQSISSTKVAMYIAPSASINFPSRLAILRIVKRSIEVSSKSGIL